MPNGIRKKAHREDEAIRSYAAALRLFRNVRRKNDKRGRQQEKETKNRMRNSRGYVFTVIVEENPTAENTALDIIGTIIRQNIDRNVGKISKDNKGRVCYLDTNGG